MLSLNRVATVMEYSFIAISVSALKNLYFNFEF